MKKKLTRNLKKIRKNVAHYLSTNRLFLTFIVFALIETVLIRNYTVRNVSDYKPFICDLALLIIIGSFGYFIKPKKQFNYFFIWLIIFTTMCVVNSIYYIFYTSFASFGLLAELGLVGDVGDSLTEKIRLIDLMYIAFPIIYFFIHSHLKNGSYYHFVSKVEKNKKMFGSTILVGVIILAFTLVNITGTDASRLVKQWNREYIVTRFGIVLYQGNDLIQSLTPKINSLFGYDEAAKNFKDFYGKLLKDNDRNKTNKYSGVLENMNVIFIHMESIQNYLVDMKINGVEMTPTINKLSKEGMYFNNFYPQVSVGTSSDTEFTLNTSLMPVSSGTVFVGYYKRNYVSIPKLLSDKGYYTFSSHGNNASMWNRNNMHPSLGYKEMYFKDVFEVTKENTVGLGISDYDYFTQLQPILEKIEDEHENYMGTLIQLSNHSPYAATESNSELYDYFDKLDLTNTYTRVNERTGASEVVKDDYLDGSKLGNYLISAHYADKALGTFFDYVNNSDHFENTVFVLYGDHDARIDKSEYQYYFNYDVTNGKVYEEGDPKFVNYDSFANEVNKKTPLIIWTKNKAVLKRIKTTNSNVMGMYDLLPTLGNMMGFKNDFALGHDIFNIGEDNVVVFPSGNFITNKVYYNNTSGNYMILNNNTNTNKKIADGTMIIGEDYISNLKKYTDEILTVSNDLIVHDLIEREGANVLKVSESEENNG